MKTEALDYDLPAELIAQQPLAERRATRLLVVDRDDGHMHSFTRVLPELLAPALVVVNDTKVIPARIHGQKATGGKVELLLVEPLEAGSDTWRVLGKSSKPLRGGVRLNFGELEGEVVGEVSEHAHLRVRFDRAGDALLDFLQRHGEMPLPPYIRRANGAADHARYQTIFADAVGAVAAPTAGLHFDETLVNELKSAGHEFARVTLHVGPGTFRPVRSETLEEHPMHDERYVLPQATADAIDDARARGRAVLAVGTTTVRVLEACAIGEGRVRAAVGRTDIFIQPGYRAQVVDHLLTNFHLPRSTLLALVMAFGGIETVRAAYASAVESRYRFFSYGDAMLIRGIR